jgi:hypothetical protein
MTIEKPFMVATAAVRAGLNLDNIGEIGVIGLEAAAAAATWTDLAELSLLGRQALSGLAVTGTSEVSRRVRRDTVHDLRELDPLTALWPRARVRATTLNGLSIDRHDKGSA